MSELKNQQTTWGGQYRPDTPPGSVTTDQGLVFTTLSNCVDTTNASRDDIQSTSQIQNLSEQHRILEILVILMGCIGTLANGLVVHVLSRSDQQKKSVHIFIINQLALDLFSSVAVILTYIWKLADVRLYGTLNFVLCLIIGSEDVLWIGLNGSIINMTFMTIERYIKIVFPIFHRNHYNKWITYFLMALAWATGFLMNFPAVYTTTDFSNGNCLAYTIYPSVEFGVFVGMYFLFFEYIIPILTFLICYGHIIVVIRRSGKQLSQHQNGDNTVQSKTNKNEKSIVKIMVTVSLMFSICWTPANVYLQIVTSDCCGFSLNDTAWYVSMILGFLNICLQPFIYVYGLKSDAIKKQILKFLGRKETTTTTTDCRSAQSASQDTPQMHDYI